MQYVINGFRFKSEDVDVSKLPRSVRRAFEKAQKKSGRATQHHKKASEIINNGYGALAPIIPVTDTEHCHMDSFLMIRYRECREGRGDSDMWTCLFTALLEGWSILKHVPLEGADYLRRTLMAAARAWDAAFLHFRETGIVNESNMDVLLSAINMVLDLKRDFRRDELICVIESLEKHINEYVHEIFDGGTPKSGWEPKPLYEKTLPRA